MELFACLFGLLSGAAAVAATAMMFRLGGASTMTRSTDSPPSREDMQKHILWRSLYVNPDDPRGWVPKTSGYGWTVNFRTRRNAGIFAMLIAICLVNAAALAVIALLLERGPCPA